LTTIDHQRRNTVSNNEEEVQELKPEKLLIEVDGAEKWVDAYNLSNAAKFIGRSLPGLNVIIENQKKAGKPVQLWKPQIGRGTYILVEDLKDLMRARPIED
jgi:hypothetical protein